MKKNAKRKSPSDFFKRNPKVEHSLYKTRGDTRKPIIETTSNNPFPTSIWPSYEKVNNLYVRGKRKPYIQIHNHPIGAEELDLDSSKFFSLPSYGDLYVFLRGDEVKTDAIYQHNPHTNETEGMYVIRKTKKTPKSGIKFCRIARKCKDPRDAESKLAEKHPRLYTSFEFGTTIEAIGDYFHLTQNPQHSKIPEYERPKERQRLLDEIARKLHLQIKYVPAKGYCYSPGIGFLKKKKDLEQRLSAIIGITGFSLSLFFLSSSVTGNAVGTLSKGSGSLIGVILLILGLAAGFFWLKNRKK